jgi:AcrR family transcriptional regulator
MHLPLSRERILDAALELLDGEGMAALSMRRLGAQLGVEAMSLYNHVPNKAALLDGIHERILAKVERPPAGAAADWQAYARHQARALHRTLKAHPNAISLFATRPAATPSSLARLEQYLGVLRQAGFETLEALNVVQIFSAFVVGHAMWTLGMTSPDGPSGIVVETDSPLLHETAKVLHRYSPERELDMGIDALLIGLAPRRRRARK